MPDVVSDTTAVVWKILVAEGDTVEAGQEVAILESMKMEIPVEAEVGGTVTKIHVEEGGPIAEGAPVVTLD